MATWQDAQEGNATIEKPMIHSLVIVQMADAKRQKPNLLDHVAKAFKEEPHVQITGASCEGPGYP